MVATPEIPLASLGDFRHTVAMRFPHFVTIVFCFITLLICADGPSDNLADKVRRIPPPGIKVPDTDRAELEAGVAEMGGEIESLRGVLKGKPALLDLLTDAKNIQKTVDLVLS